MGAISQGGRRGSSFLFPLFVVAMAGALSVSVLAYFSFSLGPSTSTPQGVTSASPTTSKVACITNLSNPPQPQYAYLLKALVNNSDFISAMQGRCFTFNTGAVLTNASGSTLVLQFYHLSPDVVYRCGPMLVHLVDDRLRVTPIYGGDYKLIGFTIVHDSSPDIRVCPPG